MGRANTEIWEDIKSEHTNCLCYSESKGLYVSKINFAPEDEVLFLPHGYKGFWEKGVQIPEENLSIKIKTNFGYCSMTYMKAIIERDGKRLLDFDKSKIFVLNNCSVTTLDVEHYAWEKLFEKIISISKGFDSTLVCNTSSISYVEEIDNILSKKEIFIKGTFTKEKTVKWTGEYIVTLFTAKKIKDLIKGCQLANITDEYFIDKTIKLCHKWLEKIQNINIDLRDNRTYQLSDCLFAIHEFMIQNGKDLKFLEYFISTTESNE